MACVPCSGSLSLLVIRSWFFSFSLFFCYSLPSPLFLYFSNYPVPHAFLVCSLFSFSGGLLHLFFFRFPTAQRFSLHPFAFPLCYFLCEIVIVCIKTFFRFGLTITLIKSTFSITWVVLHSAAIGPLFTPVFFFHGLFPTPHPRGRPVPP